MTARVIVPAAPRPRGAIFETAVALARAEGRRLLAPKTPIARELHVVEVVASDGSRFPLDGDAYVDAGAAAERQGECEFETDVVVYVPRGEP